jgi:hypothetical protein
LQRAGNFREFIIRPILQVRSMSYLSSMRIRLFRLAIALAINFLAVSSIAHAEERGAVLSRPIADNLPDELKKPGVSPASDETKRQEPFTIVLAVMSGSAQR